MQDDLLRQDFQEMKNKIAPSCSTLDTLLNLPFDQFSRNYIAASIVEKIREKYGRLKILDIGGRNGLLFKFVPHHDVHILDIREPENEYEKELLKNGKYIIGNTLGGFIGDKTFDLTLSMDMLEHVAPEDRLKVIEEMLRISSIGIIVGAPFNSPLTDWCERILAKYFKELTGIEHLWLKEHIENRPLPEESKIEDFLKKKGYFFVKIPNNNVYLWTLMQHLIFTAYRFGIDIKDVYKNYNLAFINGKLNEGELPVYRYIYFAFKDKEISNLVDITIPQTGSSLECEIEKHRLLSEVFKTLSKVIQEKNQHIANLESAVRDKLLSFGNRMKKQSKSLVKKLLCIFTKKEL